METARSLSRTLFMVLAVVGASALAQSCGSDETEDDDGAGASGTTDGSGGSGNTGNTSNGGSGNSGTGAAPANVDCPADPGMDACQICAQENCAAEVMACCDQDAMASAEGKLGCYDVVACARESGCSGMDCLTVCEEEITAAGADVALQFAQPLGDCVIEAVDMGLCPDCMGAGGAGGAGGGG